MSVQSILRWDGSALVPLDYCDMTETAIVAADSWLVTDGLALGLDLHRARFAAALPPTVEGMPFWEAAIAAIPRTGSWFPRVEHHDNGRFILRLRQSPERSTSAVLATWTGLDPRTQPRTKGPDLEAMLGIRTAVQGRGATEAVIVDADGFVVEGAYSGILWWRGDILCGPPAHAARIDSVTARTALTLATALGLDTHEEAVTPAELDGTEVWVLSALHGIRIATAWVDGPSLAERPGRLGTWRTRLDALRRPLPEGAA